MNDMLTEVRFWSLVIGDAKRTIICNPDLESRIKGWIDARGMGGIFTVAPSPHVPPNEAFMVDDAHARFGAAAVATDACTRGDGCQWVLCPVHNA